MNLRAISTDPPEEGSARATHRPCGGGLGADRRDLGGRAVPGFAGSSDLRAATAGDVAAAHVSQRPPTAVLAAHSGYFWAASDPRAVRAVLGNDSGAWAANSPAEHLAILPPVLRPHIYLNVGSSDPMRAECEAFARQLQQLGIDYRLHET